MPSMNIQRNETSKNKSSPSQFHVCTLLCLHNVPFAWANATVIGVINWSWFRDDAQHIFELKPALIFDFLWPKESVVSTSSNIVHAFHKHLIFCCILHKTRIGVPFILDD